MIVVEHLTKSYGPTKVLIDCSTTVARGEIVVVCGPSGSGKSTLIKCINGLEPFDAGRITVDGVSVADRATNLPKLRARIGMVFQTFELYPHMTATENITLAQIKALKRPRAEAVARAHALLERVGIREHADRYPANLSGGQQQRVAIARALAMDPIAMLFDEPTSALDPEMINEVLDVMTALAQDGMTMIVVTHEMNFAREVANTVYFLDSGIIEESGDPRSVLVNPSTARLQSFLSKVL
jgi:glutamate/aspartate transport system ATP-binding protein